MNICLYSEDNGRTFKDIISHIKNYIIRKDNGMQKHPFIDNRVRSKISVLLHSVFENKIKL